MALVASAACLLAAPCAQGASAPPRDISIPGGSLDAALLRLAQESGEQLLYSPELVAGRRAPPVQGRLTSDQALAALLAQSDIEAERAGPKVVVLKRRGAAAIAPGETRPFGEAAQVEPPSVPRASVVEALTVTGTHLRGVTDQPSPVLALDRGDLDRSGYETVAGALAALPQNFGGAAAEGAINTGADRSGNNTSYASGLDLRGLGANATLILLNGRRMAGAGAKGDFVDISTLPSIAVQRVEVLLDGASAIYGSDAVGGVVNVLLRRDLQGAETRISGGESTHGSPGEAQFSQAFGRRWSTGGFFLGYEYRTRSDLLAADRPFSASADLRPLGGTDHRTFFAHPGNVLRLDPATGTQVVGWAIPAGQDGRGLTPSQLLAGASNFGEPREGEDILPEQTSHAAYGALHQDVGERLEIEGDLRFGRRRFSTLIAAPTSTFTVTRANPFFVSPNGGATDSIAYSFASDLPQPVTEGTAQSFSTSLGARLDLGHAWRLESYGTFATETDASHSRGLLNASSLQEALGSVADRPQTDFNTARDGFFNPFAGTPSNTPAVLAFIGAGFIDTTSRDRVTSADLQADGPLFHLPGGDLSLALGAQARREAFREGGVNFTSGVAPSAGAKVDLSRTVTAAFAELRAPFVSPDNAWPGLDRLELSLAGRIERYDDFGTTSNPKLGALYAPLPGALLRASYGTSFRAPSLRELSDAPINSPSLLPLNGARVLSLVQFGGNPNLRPETAHTWSAGLEVGPELMSGAHVSVDYFNVRFRNRIDQPARQSLLTALSDPALASFVALIKPATNPADHARIAALLADPATSTAQGSFPPESYGAIVDARFVNTGSLQVSGIDLAASYDTDRLNGHVRLAATASDLLHYEQQLTPTGSVVERAGIAGFPAKFRARTTAEWSKGSVSALAGVNFIGAYKDATGLRIGSQETVDLQLRVAPARFAGTSLALSVRNLFDEKPPFYDSPAGVGYDATNADPIGRFVSLRLAKSW
ncbi:TonB-dependent receptor [Phenylobacterium sp.]|uniref:TonB-dependent receptor n=1 Tax=Phenylobacterium sp. TaxID=1871053 RepID=UPI002DE97F7D|nr:TonB-dependent receptor [Phenylobacterium sp.]